MDSEYFNGLLGSAQGIECAQHDLDGMKEDNFKVFLSGSSKDSPLLEHCAFEKPLFFLDPKRGRPLCLARRVTILDRDKFAKTLNDSISKSMEQILLNDEEGIRKETNKTLEMFRTESTRKIAKANSAEQSFRTMEGLLELVASFDCASIKRLKEVNAKDGFRWVRFEPDTIRLVLPATQECAKRIVTLPTSKDWLKDMQTYADPIDLQTCDEGLAIILGKKGKVIRMTYADNRPHREEPKLIEYAGSPKAIILDGKTANPDTLIERFIEEKTKER